MSREDSLPTSVHEYERAVRTADAMISSYLNQIAQLERYMREWVGMRERALKKAEEQRGS